MTQPAPAIAVADYRHTCGRLLMRARLPVGARIEIRCPRCGKIYIIDTRPAQAKALIDTPAESVLE